MAHANYEELHATPSELHDTLVEKKPNGDGEVCRQISPTTAASRLNNLVVERPSSQPQANDQTPQKYYRSEPRELPPHFLGSVYASNSYFAKRLCVALYCVTLLDITGVLAFWWRTTPITEGGLYVVDVQRSLMFQPSKCSGGDEEFCTVCSTIVVYAMLVYHMLPCVILIGLPATGIRACAPFKYQDRRHGEGKLKTTRTLFFQVCEFVSSGILMFNILVIFIARGYVVGCKLLRVQLFSFGAVLSFFGVIVEITYFARFREHVKMQLGAFKERDQTGNVRSRISQKRSRYKSERTRITDDIRKQLYKETELGNLRAIENVLTYAKIRLGDDFADDMYRNASIRCGLFGKSMKNPMHVAANQGSIRAMDALVTSGFYVNSYDKVSRVRFSTGDMFWHIARYVISNPVVSSEQAATSIFKTTLVTPLHCAVATGQTNAVRWLLDHGADPNAKSKSSYWSDRVPPLFVADSSEIVKMLLEAGANHLEIPDPGRMNTLTVLQLAYLRGNIPVAREIEKWGGDVALTPLHEAAGANDATAERS
uniref:Uncharacterized protein n=1 Tax=Globisporangium ultimum (strain ATCC 200006 / CBS 805.95 / DAOM BR144) TaxID=431595 RepID=K3WZN1_GLOUD